MATDFEHKRANTSRAATRRTAPHRRTVLLGATLVLSGCAAATRGERAEAAARPVAESTPIAKRASAAQGPSADQLRQCFDAQAKSIPFSGIVAAEHGAMRFERSAGSADAAGKIPHRRNVPYRLASVGKVFTQVGIGQLLDQGRLSLDAPIGTYLEDLPPAVAAATVEQLLRHRSGVASLTELEPALMDLFMRARTAREMVPFIVQRPLAFTPGERVQYSNGGYILLGAVIEAITGRAYADHMAAALFRPLGMRSTSLDVLPATPAPMTRLRGPGAPPAETAQPLDRLLPRRASPAGDAVSSAEDLLKLGRALLGDGLLSADTRSRIFPRRGQVWRIGQAGGSMGTNADFAVFPELGWILVTLSNYDPPAGEVMGEVLRNLIVSGTCRTFSTSERPSPFG